MNVAGHSLELLFGIGVLILGALLLWAVMRGNKRQPGEAGVETSEQATRDLYAEEEHRSRTGTDIRAD